MADWFEAAKNVTFVKTPISGGGRLKRYVRGLVYWDKVLTDIQPDVFEGFHLPQSRSKFASTILTIHDIRGLVLKEGWNRRMAFKIALEKSLRAADHVITVSRAVRNEILERYPGTSISVVYNGLDATPFAQIDQTALSAIQMKYRLKALFLLAVGHFEPRKNYLTLIDAMSHLRQKGSRIQLVMIGNDSGEMPAVKQKVAARNLGDQVKILSNLADHEVRCIYNLATLFVFPSSYEGFGIPILEAMAANCPMVLSDIPVFQEVTEGKGHYFPYNDALAMADAIDGVISSPTEMRRLVKYGAERIEDFSFAKLTSDLERIYSTRG